MYDVVISITKALHSVSKASFLLICKRSSLYPAYTVMMHLTFLQLPRTPGDFHSHGHLPLPNRDEFLAALIFIWLSSAKLIAAQDIYPLIPEKL